MSGLQALFSTRGTLPRSDRPMSRLREAGASPTRATGTARGTPRRAALRVAAALVAVGIFTVSWDRLLNVQVAGYFVKVPSVMFTAAFVVAVIASRSELRSLLGRGPLRIVLLLTGVIVAYEVVRGALSAVPTAALAQVVAVLTGAVLPAVAVLLVVRSRADLRWALRWLLAGAGVAAGFGLYQLLAFYLGWPQGIVYTGVGIGTSIGRISAFNYEPAYFAYYVVLAFGAYVTLRRLEGDDVRWRGLVAFAVVLYLANVRAVPLLILAIALLLLLAVGSNRRLLGRGAVVTAVTVVVALAVPLVVASVTASQQDASARQHADRHIDVPDGTQHEERPPAAGDEDQDEGEDGPDARRSAQAAAPGKAIKAQLRTVDPSEPTSNGPRLDLYRAVLAQVGRTPVVGVGPGNLAVALRRDAPDTVADQGAGQVVANNIVLQALADGGVPLLLLELALLAAVVVPAVRRRRDPVFPLAVAWLAVLGVGGMLTSYFFDIKVWVVLALVLAGLALPARSPDPLSTAGDR